MSGPTLVNKTGQKKAPRPKKPPKGEKEKPNLEGTRKERISNLLAAVEKKLDPTEMKITLADFIRLTQLERELEQDEQPREIIITWKDPAEKRAG